MKREWFQEKSMPHYDLTPARRMIAVRLGAQEVPTRELVSKWRDAQNIRNLEEKSRYILELKDDWDGEGAPAYAESVWKRALRFATNTYGLRVQSPDICPGPDGSIDIHWKAPNYQMLVNVPADNNAKATFYGSNSDGCTLKGSLDTQDENKWLRMWFLMSSKGK